jgi:hypothetical protein
MDAETDRFEWLVGRPVATTFLVLLALVVVMALVRIQPLQIPGYLVLVGFDIIQNSLFPGVSGSAFNALFALYLYALAVGIGNLLRLGKKRRAA